MNTESNIEATETTVETAPELTIPTAFIKLEESQAEYDRAQRYRSTVQSLLRADAYEGPQLQKLKEAMKIVFWQKYTPSVSAGE